MTDANRKGRAVTEPVNIERLRYLLASAASPASLRNTGLSSTAEIMEAVPALLDALDGMVLVRTEPDEAMIEAGFRAWFAPDGPFFPSLKSEQRKHMAAAYRAMITAAERSDNG